MDGKTSEELLDELYALTQLEEEGTLSPEQSKRYMKIVEYCHANVIEIDFAINY